MSLSQNRKLFEPAPDAASLTASGPAGKSIVPRTVASPSPVAVSAIRATEVPEVRQALRDLQILLHMRRLYHHSHPKNLESLDTTFASLQRLTQKMNGLEIRVERESLVVPKLSEAPLPDTKGELQHLAGDFQLAGIQTLVLLRQFHVGELDTLAQLIRGALLKSKEPAKQRITSWWSAKLLEYGVQGILVNVQTDRKVDTVLASLIGAMVAFGGNSANQDADAPITAPGSEKLADVLRLIARLTPPLESARGLSPEEGARGIHGALAEADRETVHLLLNAITQHGPRESEQPQSYLLRLSEKIVLESLSTEL